MLTRLHISDEWFIWTPKRGRYAVRTLYVVIVSSPDEPSFYGDGFALDAMLAFESKKTGKMTMHKSQITSYQLQNNCVELKDGKIINELEKLFYEYKPQWEKKRLIQDARDILLGKI